MKREEKEASAESSKELTMIENSEVKVANFTKDLFSNIQKDNIEAVREIMSQEGFNFNVTDEYGYFPIHIAVDSNAIKVTEYLIDIQGQSVLESITNDEMRQTPLFIASYQGHKAMAELLLNEGANANASTQGTTKTFPLNRASEEGHIEIIKLLMGKGANIEARTEDEIKSTPLWIAAKNGQAEAIKVLIEEGAKIEARTEDETKSTPLLIAAAKGRAKAIKVLIEKGAIIDAKTEDQSKFTPLWAAAATGHAEAVRVLIKKGANIEARTEDEIKSTPLWIAARYGHDEALRILIKKKANIEARAEDQMKSTPLWIAAATGQAEALKVLIEEGANIEARDKDLTKSTPLWAAADNGHAEAVRVLIKKGANIEARTEDEMMSTPLWIAAAKGQAEALKVLIKQGANIEARTEDPLKSTPLLIAVSFGHAEAVKVLIEKGAKIEARSKDQTELIPLWAAAKNGHTEIVKLLLKSGSDPDSKLATWIEHTCSAEINKLIKVSAAVKNISLLENIPNTPWELLSSNKDFALEVFQGLLIKNGIGYNSFHNYKLNVIKAYENEMPVDLMNNIKALIEKNEQVFNDSLSTIEASLISYMHGISPMPHIAPEEKAYTFVFDISKATPSGIEETSKYNKFWNDPLNEKYKTAGTYLLELMQSISSLNVLALTEILLRANLKDEEASNNNNLHENVILQEIKKHIFEFNNNTVLPVNLKIALQKAIKQYDQYKNDPLAKTAIAHEDKIEAQEHEIEAQKHEIETLKQGATSQADRISKLMEFIKNMSQHLGYDSSSLNDNASGAPHKGDLDIIGDDSYESSHHDGGHC